MLGARFSAVFAANIRSFRRFVSFPVAERPPLRHFIRIIHIPKAREALSLLKQPVFQKPHRAVLRR